MKLSILLILFFVIMPKIGFCQDSLCQHATDGNEKAKQVKITLSLPCDWISVDSKSPNQIFKFLKQEVNKISSVSLSIRDLAVGLNSSEEKDMLKLDGLKRLSDESGEIVSSKSLSINKVNGGQIIRKDAVHKFYKLYNYFIYKGKLITIAYFVILKSDDNVSDYFSSFDSLLAKTTFR